MFFTVFTGVVGLSLAATAEVLIACAASDPEFTHVNGSHGRHNLSRVILRIVVNVAGSGLHHGATGALDHVGS